jgi:hypothetical protein
MKLQVKTGQRNPIKEEGYYPALVSSIEVDESTAGSDKEMLKIYLVIDYNGEEVEYVDKTYATLGANSKLTQLAIAVGYAETYDMAVSKSEIDEGIEFDTWCGKYVRTHFESKVTKDGMGHYISLGGYTVPAKARTRPQFGNNTGKDRMDDIPF